MKTSLNSEQEEYLSIIHSSSQSLLEILNDILDFSKIEAGKLELNLENSDIRTLIKEAVDIVRFKANHKGLKLTTDIDKDLPDYLRIDSLRIKQILINLLGNAIKFTEQGFVTTELKIARKNNDKKNISLSIAVKDSGIGISEENQGKIFEAFNQEDASTTKKYGGTGLGLAISNRLLKLMGSRLNVKSTPGKGSCFYFNIETDYETISKKKENFDKKENATVDDTETKSFDIKKVLIAEDNSVNMFLTRSIVSGLMNKVKIIEAMDGKEVVEAARIESPELILMDIRMPEADGYTAASKIREFNKNVIIIALSAGAIKAEKEKSLKSGMNEYLTKPLTIKQLETTLKNLFTATSTKPSAELFDKKKLNRQLGNEEEIIKIALHSFLEDIQKKQMQIKKLEIIPENLGKLSRIFHTIKGQALNLSLPQLKQIAEKAEFLADTAEIDQIKAIIPTFFAIVKETTEAIQK